tara:strand:- start:12 stop:128 length:117 start_codon:yes stop_codon:yes gene_type:complete
MTEKEQSESQEETEEERTKRHSLMARIIKDYVQKDEND